MPKPTFHNLPDDKRERILEIAIEEFSTYAYADFSISRFVARAEIAKGSFYQYFENKLDLFRWLMWNVAGQRKLEYIRAHPPPPGADLFTALEYMSIAGLKFGLANPRLSAAAAGIWTPSADPELNALREELMAMGFRNMRAMLAEAAAAGQVRPEVDLDTATHLLITVIQRVLDAELMRRMGVDVIQFCAHPELAEQPHRWSDHLSLTPNKGGDRGGTP
ncbi:MAG: TetR/AcrR family transcriptional regulator [Deltaproteobacteria bacterium]|nr:TetR/AcrR family transcriptional regulator [Deltaproteobacteria bacterium]